MEEVPGTQTSLLALDEQQALAGEDEEPFLRPLAVVEADRLTRLEDADVDPELAEPALALEVAVEAEMARIAPAALSGVDHEPAVAVGYEAVLRLPQGNLRDRHRPQRAVP